MEHVAVALNPRQGLLGDKRLIDLLTARPGMRHVTDHSAARIRREHWALYDVRHADRWMQGFEDRKLAALTHVDRSGDPSERLNPAQAARVRDYKRPASLPPAPIAIGSPYALASPGHPGDRGRWCSET